MLAVGQEERSLRRRNQSLKTFQCTLLTEAQFARKNHVSPDLYLSTVIGTRMKGRRESSKKEL